MNNIFVITAKELKVFFRDRRTLIMTFLFPFILYPLMFNLMNFFNNKNKNALKTTKMKVLFESNVPKELNNFIPQDSNLIIVKNIEGKPEKLLENRKVQAVLEFDNNFKIKYLSSEKTSKEASHKIADIVERYRQAIVNKNLKNAGLDEKFIKPFEVVRVDTASKERLGGMILGRILPYLIMIMLFSGAMGFGLECTTGEKEKGTIATLLVSQASRVEIVVGKLLYVVIIELASGIANIAAFAFAAKSGFGKVTTTAASKVPEISFMISPGTIILLLFLIIPIGIIAAALIITMGSYAKSMKEGQTMFTPLLFVFIMIGMISMTAPVKVPEYYFYIPIVNTSFAMQELLTFKFNMMHFVTTIVTTCGLAGLLTYISIWFFNRESIHFRN
jgi:sodium transport system permease protein